MIYRDDLPDRIDQYPPALLRQLCEEQGWNVVDLAEEVRDPKGSIKARLDHYGVTPDDRKSPHENLAADLWTSSPEDYGLEAVPRDSIAELRDTGEVTQADLGDFSASDSEGGAA